MQTWVIALERNSRWVSMLLYYLFYTFMNLQSQKKKKKCFHELMLRNYSEQATRRQQPHKQSHGPLTLIWKISFHNLLSNHLMNKTLTAAKNKSYIQGFLSEYLVSVIFIGCLMCKFKILIKLHAWDLDTPMHMFRH